MPYVGKSMDRRRNRRRSANCGSMTAAEWNQAHPVGTAVRYFPTWSEAECVDSKTRSEAWALGDGSVVVLIEGKTGGVHLSHVQVAP